MNKNHTELTDEEMKALKAYSGEVDHPIRRKPITCSGRCRSPSERSDAGLPLHAIVQSFRQFGSSGSASSRRALSGSRMDGPPFISMR
jgi:hypothetical protein